MGLFDKLIKKAQDIISDVTSEENKQEASEFFNDIKEALDITGGAPQQSQQNSSYEAPEEDDLYKEDGIPCRDKILECLKTEFPSYSVAENVSPVTMGGTGRFMNYSIVIYDNGNPKLVMILIGKTTTSHREYRWSREFAEAKEITFLNFVEHYPNTPKYISERLHNYL